MWRRSVNKFDELRKDPANVDKHVYRSAIFFGGRAFQAKKFIINDASVIPPSRQGVDLRDTANAGTNEKVDRRVRAC